MAAEPALARSGYLALEGDAPTLVGSLDAGERIVEGWVTIGHAVRSAFEPCADPAPHWLLGDSPALDALSAVLELGLDSRYYVMVWGWLLAQLRGDKRIAQARNGDVSPQIAARIAFLDKAIRAIDLE